MMSSLREVWIFVMPVVGSATVVTTPAYVADQCTNGVRQAGRVSMLAASANPGQDASRHGVSCSGDRRAPRPPFLGRSETVLNDEKEGRA